MPQPLENIKVVDLTRTLAGPFCTQNLADMGADVVKIEEPNDGDETRKWPPIWNGESTQFLSFNRNKRSLSVNLKSDEGLAIVKKLAAGADIMIESFRAGTLARFGLGYDDIRAVNPDIIYCTISGYGRTGPMASKPGYDLIIQAYSGLMHLTGEPDGAPQRVGFSLVDLFTGMLAFGSIVTALYHRDQTGEGQLIDAALLDGQVAAMSYHATGYIGTGVEPHRLGSGHPSLVPYQSFPASDGYFILGVANPNLWERFCHAIGHPELKDDPKFATNPDRVAHRAEMIDLLNGVFATNTVAHWVKVIDDAGVPRGPHQQNLRCGGRRASQGAGYVPAHRPPQCPRPARPQLAHQAARHAGPAAPPAAAAGAAQRRSPGRTGLRRRRHCRPQKRRRHRAERHAVSPPRRNPQSIGD